MSDFGNLKHPKAVKDYRCEWCGEPILKGEIHSQYTGVWEGDWQNWRMHQECYDIGARYGEIQEGFNPFENERPEKTEIAIQQVIE